MLRSSIGFTETQHNEYPEFKITQKLTKILWNMWGSTFLSSIQKAYTMSLKIKKRHKNPAKMLT